MSRALSGSSTQLDGHQCNSLEAVEMEMWLVLCMVVGVIHEKQGESLILVGVPSDMQIYQFVPIW